MSGANRIKLNLLDQEILDLIIHGVNIIPIPTYSELPSEDTGKFYRVLGGTEKNNIYAWDESTGKYELIGADDKEVYWGELKGVPTQFQPISHTHSESDIIGLDKYSKSEVDTKLSEKAPLVHTHPTSSITGLDTALGQKVDKVTGKGLSTNDFTTTLKDKLESLSDSASVDYSSMKGLLDEHIADPVLHLTESDIVAIANIASKADKSYVDTQLATKASSSTVSGHTGNLTVHITQTERDNWNGKSNFSGSYNDLTDKPVIEGYTVSIGTAQPTTDMWYKEV